VTEQLLSTKLYPPQLHPGFIARPRLIEQLNEGLSGLLTLLSAPAGFGKTTLLAEWIGGDHRNGLARVAWITLDDHENDLTQFLIYLVAALESALPTLGQVAFPRLQSAEPVGAETILSLIIAEVNQLDENAVLFLDDYHLISNPAVHTAVAFLLEHAPPQFHLVIASRSDPPVALSRWRVRGQLQEIRATDLRYTPAETTRFLHRALGYPLEANTVDFLAERTEGWPAGLRLVALSLHGLDDTATNQFITNFGGAHPHIFHYLVEEVWNRQSAAVQQFLLHTSILHRLCAPLCAAVTQNTNNQPGMSDQSTELVQAQRHLNYLATNNLFVLSIDDAGSWFRYHTLFAEALFARLEATQPALIPELHRRAGRWYAAHGYTNQAIQHALAAADMNMAAELIAAAAELLWPQGKLGLLMSWLGALPEEIFHHHLPLCLTYAWLQFLHDQWDEARHYLRLAGEQLTDLPDSDPVARQYHGRWTAIEGAMAAHQQNTADTVTWMAMAQELLPVEDVHWRQVAMIGQGLAQLSAGHAREAIATFHQAALDCENCQDLYLAFAAWWHQLEACWAQGRLHGVADCLHYLELLAERDEGSALALDAVSAVGWGMLAYERNKLASAQELLTKALPRVWPGGQPRVALQAYLTLACLAQAQGAAKTRQHYLDAATQLVHRFDLSAEQMLVSTTAARLYLADGQVPEARWQLDVGGMDPDAPAEYRQERGLLTWVRVFLAEKQADKAWAILSRLLTPAERAGRNGSLLEIYLLQALVLAQQQKLEQALARLQMALALAETEQFSRIFLNEGRPMAQLLAQISPRTPYVSRLLSQMEALPTVTNLLDPLTEREIEILGLVAEGATNQDIADNLFISVGTVKGHINHILGKMDARNRTEAVALGRQWGLLD
jgi:LuxR family maltose regulon positive regulatory protein